MDNFRVLSLSIPVDEFKLEDRQPDITVEGDVMLKEFHFIVQPDKSEEKLIKIGRVSGLQLNKYLVFLKGRARREFLENCNIMFCRPRTTCLILSPTLTPG